MGKQPADGDTDGGTTAKSCKRNQDPADLTDIPEIYRTRYTPFDSSQPLPQVLIAALAKVEGRKVFTKGHMMTRQAPEDEWVVTCHANALFVQLRQGYDGMCVSSKPA